MVFWFRIPSFLFLVLVAFENSLYETKPENKGQKSGNILHMNIWWGVEIKSCGQVLVGAWKNILAFTYCICSTFLWLFLTNVFHQIVDLSRPKKTCKIFTFFLNDNLLRVVSKYNSYSELSNTLIWKIKINK